MRNSILCRINWKIYHRKSNNDRLKSPIALNFYFNDGYIDIKYGVKGIFENGISVPNQILRLLKEYHQMTLNEIRNELPQINYQVLKNKLYNLKTKKQVDNIDKLWIYLENNENKKQ